MIFTHFFLTSILVPEAGLEPARYFYRGILSPLCLPIPPLGQTLLNSSVYLRQLYFGISVFAIGG